MKAARKFVLPLLLVGALGGFAANAKAAIWACTVSNCHRTSCDAGGCWYECDLDCVRITSGEAQ